MLIFNVYKGQDKYPGKVFYNPYRGMTVNLAAQILGLQVSLLGWLAVVILQWFEDGDKGVDLACGTLGFLLPVYCIQRAIFGEFLVRDSVSVSTAKCDDFNWSKTGLSLCIIAEMTAYEAIVLGAPGLILLGYVCREVWISVACLFVWLVVSPYLFRFISRHFRERENRRRARRYPDGETPADYYERNY